MKKNFLIILLSLFTIAAFAQKPQYAKWRFEVSKKQVKVGETIELIFYADIDENWYMYSSDFKMEAGPMATTFDFKPHPSYKLVGDVKAVGSKKKYDEIFEGEYTYFTNKAEFRQKVKILKANPQIEVTYEYQVCSDKSGQCIPFEEDHIFKGITVTASADPEKAVSPGKDSKVENPDKSIDSKTTGKSTQAKPDSRFYTKEVSELEKDKARLITYDEKGNDETILYLKEFVNKYGKK